MPATVIAERVGLERGPTVLKDRVRELRPAYLPPDQQLVASATTVRAIAGNAMHARPPWTP